MKKSYYWSAFAMAFAALLIVSSAGALEKTRMPFSDEGGVDEWRGGTAACRVQYYNTCSGWIWTWSGWEAGDRLGTVIEGCCPGGDKQTVDSFHFYFPTGAPAGYGLTGSIGLYAVDGDNCPTGAPIWMEPHLAVDAWNSFVPTGGVVVPATFVMVFALSDSSAVGSPMEVATDQPFSDMGTCYPTTRTSHSFYYGNMASPVCPGSTLGDGVGDAELIAYADLSCTPVSVDPFSWGAVKALYR